MEDKRRYGTMIYILCVLLCMGMLAGCSKGKEPVKGGTFICYVDTDGTSLVKEPFELKSGTVEENIRDILYAMTEETDSIDYKSVFPKEVRIRDWLLTEGRLDIHFSSNYKDMKPAEEVLLRAAVVQTLEQIHQVEYVGFFIEDQPLTDSAGNEIGYMGSEYFLQYKGSSLHLYQLGELKLYFMNENGDKLVREEVSVRYNSNISMERLIVDQLIKGPAVEGLRPVIPPETKVIGVSVKDGVCYVNLTEGFLNNTYMTDPRLTVYAIVNSIVDGGSCSQVQISVNGESNIEYMESVDLSKPLSREQDFVENLKESEE